MRLLWRLKSMSFYPDGQDVWSKRQKIVEILSGDPAFGKSQR